MGEYDYGNARIRALKGRLFSRRDYEELAALLRIDGLIARLAQSIYANEIKDALARYRGPRVVTEACRLNLANTYRKLRGFFTDDAARLIGILLARWDLFNVKTILRGQAADTNPEEMLESLVPAGDLDEGALRSLVRQPDLTATADLLRTWNIEYGQAVHDALTEFAKSHEWSTFELAFDRVFYERLFARLKKGRRNDEWVRKFLAREIDTTNVMTAVRLRCEGLALSGEDAARFFLSEGELSQHWLGALVACRRDAEALTLLGQSKFGASCAGLEAFERAGIQRALDRDFATFAGSFFLRDPLTIAPAIGFISAKRIEATNVRLIAQSVASGLNRSEIEKNLLQ